MYTILEKKTKNKKKDQLIRITLNKKGRDARVFQLKLMRQEWKKK